MEKKNKKKKRLATGLVVTALVAAGGVLAYKKCPKVTKLVDKGFKFIMDSFKDPEPKKILVKTRPFSERKYVNFKKH